MNKIYLLALVLCTIFFSRQSAFGQYEKIGYHVMTKIEQSPENSQKEIALFVEGDIEEIIALTQQAGGTYKYSAGNIAAIRIPVHRILDLSRSEKITRIEDAPPGLQPMNDKMIINNNIVLVHMGLSPLPQGYDGSGVVIGIIDTGVDWSHPDFKDVNGKSRIKYIWDHAISGQGNSPQPYNYGREFTKAQIDSGFATAHKDKLNGHGTFVTGIAAGNGFALNAFKGAAPNADIIVVALNFNMPDNDWLSSIVDATNYIYAKAAAMGKPAVVNASVGTYYGSHDGMDLQAQLINNFLTQQNGRAFVAASGNAGSIPFHLGYTATTDTNFTWFRQVNSNILIEIWSDTAQMKNIQFAVGADIASPSYSFSGNIDFANASDVIGTVVKDTLFNANGDRLAIVDRFSQLLGSRYVMYYNIIPDSSNYLWRLMATGSGRFDVWNFDVAYNNLPNAITYPAMNKYKFPDTEQTMVSSFTCSPNVITVGEYVNRNFFTDYNGVIQTFPTTVGALAANSSKGPTRDGRIKPELTATGNVTIAAMVLEDVPWFIANEPFKLAAGGKHIRSGGTSSAAPVVAGAIALYLQKNPNASISDIRNDFFACTKVDQFTGNTLPNSTWGYGKLDAFGALAGCVTGINENEIVNHLANYPNPFSDKTIIAYEFSSNYKSASIKLYDLPGRLIKNIELNDLSGNIELEKGNLNAGSYFYTLEIDGKIIATNKLVVL
ncbi:MAG: S8 family serine peptidase [Bacteroidia bacterium]